MTTPTPQTAIITSPTTVEILTSTHPDCRPEFNSGVILAWVHHGNGSESELTVLHTDVHGVVIHDDDVIEGAAQRALDAYPHGAAREAT